MQAGRKAADDCMVFSEIDQTDDLKCIDVPTLLMHGDDDQIVPIGASAMQSESARLTFPLTWMAVCGALPFLVLLITVRPLPR